MILPVIDYGSFLYQSANDKILKTLDVVHHSGIRYCTGAFRSSPVLSLYVDSNTLPLNQRRNEQYLLYMLKIMTFKQHPLHYLIHIRKNEREKNKLSTILRKRKKIIRTQ